MYDHLPPGVLQALEQKNPPNSKWQRKHKLFQFLSDDIGNPHAEKQVAVITAQFKGAATKGSFWTSYRRNFPGRPDQLELDIEDTEIIETDPTEPSPLS